MTQRIHTDKMLKTWIIMKYDPKWMKEHAFIRVSKRVQLGPLILQNYESSSNIN